MSLSSPSLPDDDSQNFGPESDDDNQNFEPESDDDDQNFGAESDEDLEGLQFGQQGQGDSSSQSDSDLDRPSNETLSSPSSSSKSNTNDQNFSNDTTPFLQYAIGDNENIDIDYSTGSALSDATLDDTIPSDDEENSGIFDCFGESNFPEEDYISDDDGDELFEQNEDSPDITICRTLAQTILSKKTPKERRPLLSIVASSVSKAKAESEVFMNEKNSLRENGLRPKNMQCILVSENQ